MENNRKRKVGESLEEECPYLDQIQRSLLDFDLDPVCSVSLEREHVYACLVCGKYFRGRGRQTPAYTHSVEESHFVFVHLSKGTFHCLPDDYEIKSPSVQDIRDALHPTFTPESVASIDSKHALSRDIFGRRYIPGFVGLNNLQKTDGINAILQALSHVKPLRDFFLSRNSDDIEKLTRSKTANRLALEVTQAFGELVRKIWSDKRFKSSVDPHKLVHSISAASKKRFQIGVQSEAGDLIAWLLHQLHLGTGGSRKPGSSVIHRIFQGQVRVTTRRKRMVEQVKVEEDDRYGSEDEDATPVQMKAGVEKEGFEIEETTADTHFLQLTLDLSDKPLFRDSDGGLVIPQEPLNNVLKKFDGNTYTDTITRSGEAQRKKYELLSLPEYLILHISRFNKTEYSREKNPSIVVFPIKSFDLGSYIIQKKTEEEIRNMKVRDDFATRLAHFLLPISSHIISKVKGYQRLSYFIGEE